MANQMKLSLATSPPNQAISSGQSVSPWPRFASCRCWRCVEHVLIFSSPLGDILSGPDENRRDLVGEIYDEAALAAANKAPDCYVPEKRQVKPLTSIYSTNNAYAASALPIGPTCQPDVCHRGE